MINDKSNSKAWIGYIETLLKLKRFRDAQKILIELVEKGATGNSLDDLRVRINYLLGEKYFKEKRFKKALVCYQEVNKLRPTDAETLYKVASIYYSSKAFEEAIKSYKSILAIDPKNTSAYIDMGSAFIQNGDIRAAMKAYKIAISINPEISDAYYNLGNCFLKLEDWKSAIRNYRQAIRVDSSNAEAYNNLGIAYDGLRNNKRSLACYEHASKINPHYVDALLNTGNAFIKKRQSIKAINYFQRALEINPDSVEAYNGLGVCFKNTGKLNNSISNFKNSIRVNPEYIQAYLNLESIYLQLSDLSKVTSLVNTKVRLLLENDPEYQIHRVIFGFIKKDRNLCEEYLNKFRNSILVSGHRDSTEQVKNFSNAYFYLINHLIEFVDFQSKTGFDVLYHIGESHCLSYAHSHISINDNKYSICPKLTLGGKAFHFADLSNNGYKEITLNNLNSLKKRSIVFISFGEIDCRENEGLVTASNKLGIQLETLVQKPFFVSLHGS